MKLATRIFTLLVALAASPAQAGDTIYYYHNDHLGTPQKMTDENQIIVWDVDYKPFGIAFGSASIENNLRFPGQYYDSESELHYNYFRDYDPGIGRYIQSDPIGLRGGINTYGYVGSNPLSRIDPNGQFFFVAIWGWSSVSALADLTLATAFTWAITLQNQRTSSIPSLPIIYNNEGTGDNGQCGAADAPLQPTAADLDGWIYGPQNDPKINEDGSTEPNTWVTPDDYDSAEEAQDRLDPFKPTPGRSPVTIPSGTNVQQGFTPGGQGPYNGSGGATEILVPDGLPPGSVGPWEAI